MYLLFEQLCDLLYVWRQIFLHLSEASGRILPLEVRTEVLQLSLGLACSKTEGTGS